MFDAASLVLLREPHVKPYCAVIVHDALCFLIGQIAQQGLLDQFDEIRLGQTHQGASGQHHHRCIAFGVRDQRLLSEGVAGAQQREFDRRLAGGNLAADLASAVLNDVVILADIPLAHDSLAALDLDRFETGEDTLDIRRRHPTEQLGLQHARHPVAVVLRFDLGDSDILHLADPVKREQFVQQIATDPQNIDVTDRAR